MLDECNAETDILVTCYEGFMGITIRIDTRSTVALTRLRNGFLDLASGEVRAVEMRPNRSPTDQDPQMVVVELILEDREPNKAFTFIGYSPEGLMFRWARSSEGWTDCAGLLDGLLVRQRPGHQYLTDEAVDDALVVAAFLEDERSR